MRHPHVDDERIERLRLDEVDGLARVVEKRHLPLMPHHAQHPAEALEHLDLVVHEQDLLHAAEPLRCDGALSVGHDGLASAGVRNAACRARFIDSNGRKDIHRIAPGSP